MLGGSLMFESWTFMGLESGTVESPESPGPLIAAGSAGASVFGTRR